MGRRSTPTNFYNRIVFTTLRILCGLFQIVKHLPSRALVYLLLLAQNLYAWDVTDFFPILLGKSAHVAHHHAATLSCMQVFLSLPELRARVSYSVASTA